MALIRRHQGAGGMPHHLAGSGIRAIAMLGSNRQDPITGRLGDTGATMQGAVDGALRATAQAGEFE